MDNIQLLVSEHDNILKMISIMEKKAIALMNDRNESVEEFFEFIDFARNYADKHHHGKEELILFKYMVRELGPAAEKLVNNGMLVEHDLGRLYVSNLEEAVTRYRAEKSDELRLAVLTNAMGYGEHLRRHIAKENDVVYTFAQRSLSDEVMCKIEDETLDFEAANSTTKLKYENWLNDLAGKYN
ncbi:Hemerythrin-like domain-containing protein [Peptostreptococcaceae bacterium pGA-8]|nr:Hemerythrin-like domain-containing protein [Peptostreptococcaceae bacterium pGA-8]